MVAILWSQFWTEKAEKWAGSSIDGRTLPKGIDEVPLSKVPNAQMHRAPVLAASTLTSCMWFLYIDVSCRDSVSVKTVIYPPETNKVCFSYVSECV